MKLIMILKMNGSREIEIPVLEDFLEKDLHKAPVQIQDHLLS